jgi:hypothetical protein
LAVNRDLTADRRADWPGRPALLAGIWPDSSAYHRGRSRSPSPCSRRDLPGAAQLGRKGLPQPHLLQRGRQGRLLRGVGGARAVLCRGARGLLLPAIAQGARDGSLGGRDGSMAPGSSRSARRDLRQREGPRSPDESRPVRKIDVPLPRWPGAGHGRSRIEPGWPSRRVVVRAGPGGLALGRPRGRA